MAVRRLVRHVLPAVVALGVAAGTGATARAQRSPRGDAGGPPAAPLVLKGKCSFRGPGAIPANVADGGAERVGPQSIQVKVFDGFELKTVSVKADGDFSMPIARATDGTFLAVYATRVAAVPQVRQIEVRRTAEAVALDVPEMRLAPLGRANVGTLVGHAYVRTEGGRANRQRGIVRFDANLPLTVEGPGGKVETRTDENGTFRLELAPGTYTITSARNVVQKAEVRPGETTIAPVYSGQIAY